MTTDPKTLMSLSKSFQSIPDGRRLSVLAYLLNQINGGVDTPETLMTKSEAFQSMPDGRKLDVLNYLSCKIAP